MSSLARLRELLAAEQGLLAASLADRAPDPGWEVFGPLAGAGERTRASADEYELLVESIFEGYLIHYSRPRLIEADDPDLRLLCGDYMYAFGLTRLARIGDLTAVEELADLISLCAHVHADSPAGEEAPRLAASVWALGVLAVASGSWDVQREAKQLVRERAEKAAETSLAAARERAADAGLGPGLERSLIAFDRRVNTGAPTT